MHAVPQSSACFSLWHENFLVWNFRRETVSNVSISMCEGIFGLNPGASSWLWLVLAMYKVLGKSVFEHVQKALKKERVGSVHYVAGLGPGISPFLN